VRSTSGGGSGVDPYRSFTHPPLPWNVAFHRELSARTLLEPDMDPREGYRRAAAECIEASRQTSAPGTRIELLIMAMQFLELAKAKLRIGRVPLH
jgi:hypothetical protein